MFTQIALSQQPSGGQGNEEADPNLTTLNVYTTHLQVTALVIDRNRQPVTVPPGDFLLTLDHGKPFTPLSVHRATHDPISLAILIDATVDRDLLKHLPKAIGALRGGLLQPEDTVLLLAVGCAIQRFPGSTNTAESLADGVQGLLRNPELHRPGHDKEMCADSLRLWDGAAAAIGLLSSTPGRHVVLMITGGADVSSQTSRPILVEAAHRTATTIFTLPDAASLTLDRADTPENRAQKVKQASELARIAEGTGGIALRPAGSEIHLDDFVTLLRGRYILEFPRPRDFRDDHIHIIEASVRNSTQPILLTGTSAPVTQDQLRRDPNTIRYDGADGGALVHDSGLERSPDSAKPTPSLSGIRLVNPDFPMNAPTASPQTQQKPDAAAGGALLPCVDGVREGDAIRFTATCDRPQIVVLYDGSAAKPEQIDVLPGKPVSRTLTQPEQANFFACPAATHPVTPLGQPLAGDEQDYGCVPN